MRSILNPRIVLAAAAAAAAALVAYALFSLPAVDASAELPTDAAAIARGEYLIKAGGCISCHLAETEPERSAETLSGGHALATEFGVFYAPNITPDPATGIGGWSAQDFLLALQHGRSPAGGSYFPAFPYRSYAGLTDDDVLAIGAYLLSLEPVVNQVPAHETPWWLGDFAMPFWNLLADMSEGTHPAAELEKESSQQAEAELLERGAYLARHLGHCGECHTPRSALGISQLSQEFAGASLVREGGDTETIEAIDKAALADWTRDSFDLFLLLGLKADGDFVGGEMSEVIDHNTSRLTDEDRLALAAFFTR